MTKARHARKAVLVVGGDERYNQELASELDTVDYELVTAGSVEHALAAFDHLRPPLVLLNLPVSGASAAEVAREMLRLVPDVMLILIGTDGDVGNASDAFQLGAYDHLDKASPESLLSAISGALGISKSSSHLRCAAKVDEEEPASVGFGDFASNSPAMQQVAATLRQICRRTSHGGAPTILLTGETGTGKGFFAKCIHYNSARRSQPFVEINCAALPPSLIEAELFGYERGAFTDAKSARMGLFEAANGGTLFLDEIAALPLDLQAKLLTAIEEKQVRRLGARQSTRVDVQIVAATHENLEQRCKSGQFRQDLFHRLNVVAVTIPPLRERGADAVQLTESFIAAICAEYGTSVRTLTEGAREWIRRYPWPGNVRELRNRIERIILLENDDEIRAEHFAPTAPAASSSVRVSLPPAGTGSGLRVALPREGVPLEQLERAVIREALVQCNGNVSRAARFLSISRQTLIYRMKKYRLALRPDSGKYPRLTSIAPSSPPSAGRRAAGR